MSWMLGIFSAVTRLLALAPGPGFVLNCLMLFTLSRQEAMFEATVAHGAQLREMRIDTNTLQLKPLGEAKNRLINRR